VNTKPAGGESGRSNQPDPARLGELFPGLPFASALRDGQALGKAEGSDNELSLPPLGVWAVRAGEYRLSRADGFCSVGMAERQLTI